MTTREKIIVGLMCLAIVYGAWELLGNREKTTATPSVAENPVAQARSLISELSQKVIADRVPDTYHYIIDQAGETWTKDPFLLQNDTVTTQKSVEKAPVTKKEKVRRPPLAYTGFLQAGKAKLAIINGLEYAVGDSLNFDDFYVKAILPQKVIVAQTKGPGIMELYMQESFPK